MIRATMVIKKNVAFLCVVSFMAIFIIIMTSNCTKSSKTVFDGFLNIYRASSPFTFSSNKSKEFVYSKSTLSNATSGFGSYDTLFKYCDDHYTDEPILGSDTMKELSRFREKMAKWSPDIPKGAVILLIDKDPSRLKMLKRLLLQYENNFVNKFTNYPVILFYSADFPSEMRKRIKSWSKKLDIFMQEVRFLFPNCYVINEIVPVKAPCSSKHTVGYRHMCRFMMLKMYHQPIVLQLEYYWRLDTDSGLMKPLPYDVFKKMRNEDILYAYGTKTNEYAPCMLGLRESSERYVHINNIKTSFLSEWGPTEMYYNNFEVSKVSFWTSAPVQNYLRFIDMLGGVYYVRWGDAPIKSIAVAIFMPKTKVRRFTEVDYAHPAPGGIENILL